MAVVRYFKIRPQINEELLLEVEGGFLTPGASVVTGYKDNVKSENWYSDQEDGCIRSQKTGYYMDTNDCGDQLEVRPMNQGTHLSRKWKISGDHIVNAQNNKLALCLASPEPGQHPTSETFSIAIRQKWAFANIDPVPPVPPVRYVNIKPQIHMDLQLEVQGGSDRPGASVVTGYKDNVKSETWYSDQEDGCIRSKETGYYMDTNDSSQVVINPMDQATPLWRKWKISGEHIVNAQHSSLALNLRSSRPGQNILTCDTMSDAISQKWTFANINAGTNMASIDYFNIKSQINMDLQLEVQGGSDSRGASVVTGYKENVKRDTWYSDQQDGCIRSKETGYYMDTNDSSQVVINPMDQATPLSRKWKISGEHIVNAQHSSLALYLCSSRPGKNILTCDTISGAISQKWAFDNMK